MLSVERGVEIHRPIEQVFTFVANFENEPQYNPSRLEYEENVARCDRPGNHPGREKVRLAGTHNRTVTIYEPPHTLVYQNDGRPFPVAITFHFASVPGGTRLTASPKIQLGGLFKLGAPLFHLLLPKLVERIVSNIKKVLEAQPLTS